MTFWFSLILLAATAFYVVFIGRLAGGFRRVRRAALPEAPTVWPMVSVVVAARDEEASIEACLATLRANAYPSDRFEIIVVDDFSEDRTAELVRRV